MVHRASLPSCIGRGWEANHKRVHRIMAEDNLLCLRRRFVLHSESGHEEGNIEGLGYRRTWSEIRLIRSRS